MKRAWVAANVVMLLLFLFSVVVQYNDPDPWVWMPVYGAAAVACVLELRGALRGRAWIPLAFALASIVWAAAIAPRVLGKVPFTSMFGAWEMQNVGVEESREMYGLLIVAGWMIAVAFANRARRAHAG